MVILDSGGPILNGASGLLIGHKKSLDFVQDHCDIYYIINVPPGDIISWLPSIKGWKKGV